MEIRTETITYSKAKRKESKNRETYLQEKLDALDNQLCRGSDYFNQVLLDEYESIKTELKDMYEKRGKEAMFRSKARWIEKGEKPTRYFFNLEKRNFEKKTIAQLKLVNGEIVSDMKQINKEIESFYSDLLETKLSGSHLTDFGENFNTFVENLAIPKLSVEQSMALEVEITLDELCRGIPLPDGQNAKISQFADDTTLILEDTISLRKAMNIVNSFGALSGLQLNKKKTKTSQCL